MQNCIDGAHGSFHSRAEKKRKTDQYDGADAAEGYFGSCPNEACKHLLRQNAKLMQEINGLKEENSGLKDMLEAFQKKEEEEEQFSDDEESVVGTDPWSLKFVALCDYKKLNGNCVVPQNNKLLGIWVKDQRALYKKGKMSQDRIDKLNSIGFSWGKGYPAPKTWDEWYEELKKRKEILGTCNDIPLTTDLGKWILLQRKQFKRFRADKHSLLNMEQIQLLKELGLKWNKYSSNAAK